MTRALLLAAVLPCAACSSIFEGRTQEIQVNTDPAGASCTLMRQNQTIGSVPSTPGSVLIEKTKDDITVRCEKPGYLRARLVNASDVAGATFGNILGGMVGGPIGWGVDSATGADNKYDGTVNIRLYPAQVVPPPGSYPRATPPSS
jgi:hypothetical protein